MPEFENAAQDYRFLRNRGYPERGTLKLIGDRYRLSAAQRNCLFRGVIPAPIGERRRRKLVGPRELRLRPCGVDWFNVLITVESYLKGFPVFICDDGVLRDASGIHGSYRPTSVTAHAREKILEALAGLGPSRVEVFLDSPIAFSGDMAEELRGELGRRLAVSCDVRVVPSADYALKSFAGVVASSDSVIMDAAQQIFDLPRHVLVHGFGGDPAPLPGSPVLKDAPRAEGAPPQP